MKSRHANVAERGEEEVVCDFAFVALHNQSTKSIAWYSTEVHLTLQVSQKLVCKFH